MGIIKAATGSVGGVMADQWLEVYTCNSIPERYLSVRAEKKTGERSSNTKGEENVISDGSTVIVHPGQCALAIDKGKVTGVFDQPGENVYHTDRSPSIFHKGGLKGVLRQSFDRFGYGGIAAVYQVIMYIDTREHFANPFSVRIPLRLRDTNRDMELDATLTVGGMFSFRIADPAVFYTKVCGNSTGAVEIKTVLPTLTAELEMVLRQTLSKLCQKGTTAYDLGSSAFALTEQATAIIDEKWIAERGFAISSIGIDEIRLMRYDKNLLQSVEMARALTDPTLAAATLVGATAQAMQDAAKSHL